MVLGLSDDEFFDLTPRQFQLLQNRHKEITVHEELLYGILATTIANFSMGRPDPPRIPSDFMPSEWQQKKHEPKKRRNKKKEAQNFTDSARRLVGALTAQGKVVRAK
jgi:hypothetical protein